jgi:glycosyltransferase involved in cell wall biosynthesis
MGPNGISVVINTRNEEGTVAGALRSVAAWASEIVVVDMHSTDRTREIAAAFGARVLLHDQLGFADPARAFAVEQASCPWVLVLDADEVVPPPLAARLLGVARADEADVVDIAWANYLLGRRFLGCGWGGGQDRHPRFFKRGSVTLSPELHRYMVVRPGARVLRLPASAGLEVLHFNYRTCEHFMRKLNRYSGVRARQTPGRPRRWDGALACFRAAREFAARYLWRAGYRDGWRGLSLALLGASFHVAVFAKRWEAAEGLTEEGVAAVYSRIAEEAVAGYSSPEWRRAAPTVRPGLPGDAGAPS